MGKPKTATAKNTAASVQSQGMVCVLRSIYGETRTMLYRGL